ncbi:CLUMA_CG017146, isoform A [Clunio marinus]|uniref:CLUMA_CG017146, isoform A n=1 Tax=Clunio marinus TaxID=568069 RepID=A0A1J1IY14_9DIPT|nr:CLUMA_CG017146, isoform A [Clunio marinus]
MKLSQKIVLISLVLLIVLSVCEAKKRRIPTKKQNKIQKQSKLPKIKNQKQLLYETRETSPPNFVTLLIFRLVYGIASQMGVEDRLPGFIAPPNAEPDYGFFSFGGETPSIFGGGGDDDYDFGF